MDDLAFKQAIRVGGGRQGRTCIHLVATQSILSGQVQDRKLHMPFAELAGVCTNWLCKLSNPSIMLCCLSVDCVRGVNQPATERECSAQICRAYGHHTEDAAVRVLL